MIPDTNAEKKQLSLISEERFSWKKLLDRFKYEVKRREQEIELMPFWRGLGTPFAIVTSIAVFIMAFISQLLNFSNLGPTIPFFYNSSEGRWATGVEKSVILFLAIGYAIVIAIVMRLVFEIYKSDHRLSQTLSWVTAIINVLILFALGQLILLAKG